MSPDLDSLQGHLSALGATHVFVKALAANDNSKNQIYCGGELSNVSWLPTGAIVPSVSGSAKKSRTRAKFQLKIALSWLGADGALIPVPGARLIFYPQYPEVRLSGFLAGAPVPAELSSLLQPARRGREVGRVLLLAPLDDGRSIAVLCDRHSTLARQLSGLRNGEPAGVFVRYGLASLNAGAIAGPEPRTMLLAELCRIGSAGWLDSEKLNRDGVAEPYQAPNGGGYTLESALGIRPNGIAEPDFHGWEVKQYGVKRLGSKEGRAITLMTPEPTGGLYQERGVEWFLRTYGYPDSKIPDRLNFSSIHRSGERNPRTGLVLGMPGVDPVTGHIGDPALGVTLFDNEGREAAVWSYSSMLEHWKRKHDQAVFIRSEKRIENGPQYRFSTQVHLAEGASISLLLRALRAGHVYYDPGIKMERASSERKIKRRSQFRVRSDRLHSLYRRFGGVDACTGKTVEEPSPEDAS